MWKYVLKRLIILLPVLFGATFIVYLLFYFAPGNADRSAVRKAATPEEAEIIREERGLNDPILVQYARTMKEIFAEDSYVRIQLGVRLPKTIKLTLAAGVVTLVLALPIGVWAAIKQNTLFDNVSMLISFFGVSMPNFWLGMLMLLFFALYLGWFPTSGSQTLSSLVLPAFTLAFGNMLCEVFSGSILVELIFSWPGIGRLLVDSINERDFPMILGCVITFAFCFSIINLVVDLLYVVIDPRIRSQFNRS